MFVTDSVYMGVLMKTWGGLRRHPGTWGGIPESCFIYIRTKILVVLIGFWLTVMLFVTLTAPR